MVKLLSMIKPEDNDVFVLYDVTALFTSAPCDEVVEIAVKRTRNNPT